MLLDKSNFPDDQKVIVLSIALSKVKDDNNITPGDIEAAMRRIQGTNSTPTSTGDVFESVVCLLTSKLPHQSWY